MVKAPGLPDVPKEDPNNPDMLAAIVMPFWDQDGVHEIYKEWRKILDSYPDDRMAVAEAWVHPATRIARYLRPGELMNSFNFEFLGSKWDVNEIKTNINKSIEALSEVGAPSSWVFNNHDVVRSVDRFDLGLGLSGGTTLERQGDRSKFNLQRGRKRAKAGALLMFALPGGAYVYQGEELTLPEARDIPEDRLSDPRWKMSDYTDRGRDGCRVPLPWKKDSNGAFGFSNNAALTIDQAWLPQSPWWGKFSAESQDGVNDSTLSMYQEALAIRKAEQGLGDGPMTWIEAGKDVVAFSRPGNFACYINFGAAIEIPAGAKVLISSGPLDGNSLPTDTAAWLRLA
jgi:alpha-glucosidase